MTDHTDEATIRDALTVAFDTCDGCRRCLDRCGVFPTLVELLDGRHDAGLLTPAQQDEVSSRCWHCGLCVIDCPFAPGLDVPTLMVQAAALRRRQEGVLRRARRRWREFRHRRSDSPWR